MSLRGAILVAGLLVACAGAARGQDPTTTTLDTKALCGLLDTEPGEAVRR